MEWIVPISNEERAQSALFPQTAAAGYEALRTHGCLILRGAFDTALIDSLLAEFKSQYGGTDLAAMEAQAARPAPNAILKVGGGRFEITPRMTGAFGNPQLFANALLCRFLAGALTRDMRLSGFTAIVSHPGADLQHIHRDHAALFDEPGLSATLPHYAINVSVPLIDVDAELGPTAIWPGSHRWAANALATPETATIVPFERGDCVLIDYRTFHTGTPNKSSRVRPILYLVYARTWFFDEVNHLNRPSLDLTLEEFHALPKGAQSLLLRAFSQNMRAKYFIDAAQARR
jgi:hypothetical protein